MATEFNTPFDMYRASLQLGLRMLCFGDLVRQRTCEFEMLRIKRDFAATEATRQAALGAHDWNDFGASCQTTLRNYIETTKNLWLQGCVSTMQQQSAYSDGMREALAMWRPTWTNQWLGSTHVNPMTIPVDEWMRQVKQAFEGALEETHNGSAPGEHHVG